jgi:ABC-2 type transport system ATP-binding protein
VNELRDAGATVLLSSHILAEVEALADRVTIIREGRTIETGSLAQLRQLSRTSVTVRTRRPATEIASIAGVRGFAIDDGQASFDVDHEHLDDAMEALARLGIETLTCTPPSLEQLFVRRYAAVDPRAEAG